MQLSRENVEGLLDLQVMSGRMTPELKEEKLREFDRLTQQNMNQSRVAGFDNRSYPRVGQAQGILSGPEMLVIFALAVVLVICAKRGSGWSAVFLTGVLFTYISARALAYSFKNGKGFGFKFIIALICGIAMLAYGIFLKVGSEEAKAALDSHNDILAVGGIIFAGAALIIGSLISNNVSKKKFTQRVEGKCVELRTPPTGRSVPVKLSPVYEYYFNGQYQRVMNGTYFNKGYPEVGETREIFINPDIPGDYYEPKMTRSITIFLCILGMFFIGMGVLVCVLGM